MLDGARVMCILGTCWPKKLGFLLLEGVSRSKLPAATVRKLEHLDLIEDLDNLPRNLGVFFRKNAH